CTRRHASFSLDWSSDVSSSDLRRPRKKRRPGPAPRRARVLIPGGEHGVAPGQACVFYEDAGPEARILGGGWIARTRGAMGDSDSRLTAEPVTAGIPGQ